jgi:hypothetical protein
VIEVEKDENAMEIGHSEGFFDNQNSKFVDVIL